MDIQHIQQRLEQLDLDAWFMYDFRASNSIAWKICDIPANAHCTRRWAVVVPRKGDAIKIVHAIEAHTLDHLSMKELRYSRSSEWQDLVTNELKKYKKVALEYSPQCALPVVSKIDAGTMDWLRTIGCELHSSATLAQYFQAVWTQQQIDDNAQTSAAVAAIMQDAMQYISSKLRIKQRVTEFDVQQHIVRLFADQNLVSDSEPIVAIAPNASSPHYAPSPAHNAEIVANQLVLIDMWAKSKHHWATYNDITWMCYTGTQPDERSQKIFTIVRDARESALRLVRERFLASKAVLGFEVDDAARSVIDASGFGQYFIHRTGHNIAEETHGAGANMDNFETHDERQILPGMSFSIEPGIYIPAEIGVRSEISVVVDLQSQVLVPGHAGQMDIECLG